MLVIVDKGLGVVVAVVVCCVALLYSMIAKLVGLRSKFSDGGSWKCWGVIWGSCWGVSAVSGIEVEVRFPDVSRDALVASGCLLR